MKSYLILSIDLDEWYHCRWATGSPIARWQNVNSCFQNYYKLGRPIGEIIEPTHKILNLLEKEKIKATFFVLGEVAQWYPDLVCEIAQRGHEIACHGMHHQDITLLSVNEFSRQLIQARSILEQLIGCNIIGYRAPNLVTAKWLQKILIEQKFIYDSSVCFGRKIQGKWNNKTNNTLVNPYRICKNSLFSIGNSNLIEIPIPIFPILKLPGAVSIATRIFGWTWTKITLNNALKMGAACYYMHPYEFNQSPKLKKIRLLERIFLRRTGYFMEMVFRKLLNQYKGRIISAKKYISNFFI